MSVPIPSLKVPQTPSSDSSYVVVRDSAGRSYGMQIPRSIVPETDDRSPAVCEEKLVGLSGKNSSLRRAFGKATGPSLPPMIHSEVQSLFRGYYQVTSTASQDTCTRQSVAGAMGIVATGVTSAVCIHTSFRIRKIIAWPASSNGTGLTAEVFSLRWNTGGTAEQALQKDEDSLQPIPPGTVTKSLVFVPPKGSYAAMWQLTNSNPSDVLFQVTGPVGSIILLECDITQGTLLGGLQSPGAVVGLTSGAYYRYSLDASGANTIKALTASAF